MRGQLALAPPATATRSARTTTGISAAHGGVGDWTAKDWNHELTQFDALLFHGTPLGFGPSEIVGGRTPCLEGNLSVLYPVLARRGFRYDASGQALLGTWPVKRDGIWSFPLLELPFIGPHLPRRQHGLQLLGESDRRAAGAGRVRDVPHALERVPRRVTAGTARRSRSGITSRRGNRWAYDHALTRFLLRGVPHARRPVHELRAARRLARRARGVDTSGV